MPRCGHLRGKHGQVAGRSIKRNDMRGFRRGSHVTFHNYSTTLLARGDAINGEYLDAVIPRTISYTRSEDSLLRGLESSCLNSLASVPSLNNSNDEHRLCWSDSRSTHHSSHTIQSQLLHTKISLKLVQVILAIPHEVFRSRTSFGRCRSGKSGIRHHNTVNPLVGHTELSKEA